LIELRRSRSWRDKLLNVISPRHVQVKSWQVPIISHSLQEQGWLIAGRIAIEPSTSKPDHQRNVGFSYNEQAYMLAALLLLEGLSAPFSPPPGLFTKLIQNLKDDYRMSAARKADRALKLIYPDKVWETEEEIPKMPEPALIDLIAETISKQEPLDILYQVKEKQAPEYRRIQPLLLEERNGRYYLLAYCHMRRANRTFRVDRIRLVEFPFC
jgi:hypothetical protein